jgi:hypothetical protein
MLGGTLTVPTAFSPLEWHVLVYGYVPSIVAGFLLTAIPNWTGSLPVTGGPLLALVATWAAGRLAILASARIGAPLAALVDLLFLGCLAGVIARKIAAGRNVRNVKILALVAPLLVGNAAFHWEGGDARRRRLRHAGWHRRHRVADHFDRWPHHSKLHPQVARSPTTRMAAGPLRTFRRCLPWRRRVGHSLLLSPPTTGRPGRSRRASGKVAFAFPGEKTFCENRKQIIAL